MTDLELAVAAARAGAAIVVDGFGRAVETEYKGRFDPVTEIDRASEKAIVDIIRAGRGDDAIVAEEGGGIESGGRHWIIDPLDGTVNFVSTIPHLSVSVALWDGATPLVGVVLDPLRDEEFTAKAGAGAQLNGATIQVSRTDHLERAVVATGFAYDHGDHAAEYTAVLESVLEVVNGIRRFGSAALDLAWVAAGRFDAYWELGVSPWDQAAGILLVREAGGRVTDPFGADSVPGTRLVLASNGVLHQPLADRVAPVVPPRLR
ncbi:MAG: inositol monophosphatase family protein [Acidimicrobiia bacterium]|nr:MAG: inositol monophosphatase family protein [Acidimicrobiia bacterium]